MSQIPTDQLRSFVDNMTLFAKYVKEEDLEKILTLLRDVDPLRLTAALTSPVVGIAALVHTQDPTILKNEGSTSSYLALANQALTLVRCFFYQE
jgi:hypothetical protein